MKNNQMPKKKTIFFDATGTLFYVSYGVGSHYSRIAEKYGVFVDPLLIDKRFHDAYGKSAHVIFENVPRFEREQAEKEWWYNLVKQVFDGVLFPAFDSFLKRSTLFSSRAPEKKNGRGHFSLKRGMC